MMVKYQILFYKIVFLFIFLITVLSAQPLLTGGAAILTICTHKGNFDFLRKSTHNIFLLHYTFFLLLLYIK